MFYTFFLLHRPMCGALNERNYWLIQMNIRKTPQAWVFSFIVLNLVEEAVVHFLLNMLDYIKQALRNKQLIIFNADNFRRNSKSISFQFHYRKSSQQSYFTLSYYYRHVTKGRSWGRSFLAFLENWRKVPWFWEKALLVSRFACNTRMIVDANSSPPIFHVK